MQGGVLAQPGGPGHGGRQLLQLAPGVGGIGHDADVAAGQRAGDHLCHAAGQPQPGGGVRVLDDQLGQHRDGHGRRTAGSFTTMAAITQLLPYPVFAGPGADPSWNQDAAQTFLPRRRNKVSSIATTTGSPAGTSSATTRRATARPRSSAFQRARAKNRCARSCGQIRDKPAPASIPHTVRFPAWDKNPKQAAEGPERRRGEQRPEHRQQTGQRDRNRQRRIREHRREPRFISGFHPGNARPPPPRGSGA